MGMAGFNRLRRLQAEQAGAAQQPGELPNLVNGSALLPSTQPLKHQREKQLREQHWRSLETIAKQKGYPPKPDGIGWHDHVVPLILKSEGY